MCIYAMRKGECMNPRCSFRHLPRTKRPLPPSANTITNKDAPKTVNGTSQQIPTRTKDNSDNSNNENANSNANSNANLNADHFLEIIRLMKAEIIQEMDSRLEKMTCQINQSHSSHQPIQSQTQQSSANHYTDPQMQQTQACTNPAISYPRFPISNPG